MGLAQLLRGKPLRRREGRANGAGSGVGNYGGHERVPWLALERNQSSYFAGDREIFAGGDDEDAGGGPAGGDVGVRPAFHVRVSVELEPEVAEVFADPVADDGRVLAHARGEDQPVHPAERRRPRPDRLLDAVGVNVPRKTG